jgi:nucleoside-diphosphate-sugar epimerase
MKLRKIGITGADGTIGTVLRPALAGRYEISSFTMKPAGFPSTAADLSRAVEVRGLFDGLDAVIHLAADPSPAASWESVRENNIEATFQVFEECRRAGVERLVFASTNHTQHGNTMRTTPETLDPSRGVTMATTDLPNLDSS